MGCVTKVLDNPLTQIASDVAAAATGNAEFIPLINAGETTAGGVAGGESVGKALGQGAISGAEALGGQELAGAVGIGSGNSAFNNALGITTTPASTGLPDIGGAISSGLNSVGKAASSALGGVEDFLGIGTPAGNSSVPDISTPASSAGGSTSIPASGTSISPSSGAVTSAANAPSLGLEATNALLSPGAISGSSTTASPDLGTLLQTPEPATLPSLSTPVTPSADASSSGRAFLKTLETGAAKAALPLGALAYEAIKGRGNLPSSAQSLQAGGAATAPLLGMESQAAQEATTGQLTPSQQATIMQSVQDQKNALIQQLASEGVTNFQSDSRYIAGLQQIQNNAMAQQQAYITQAINEAVAAGGGAGANLSSVANAQISQDKDFQDALSAAVGALGTAVGGGSVHVG